MSDIQKNDYPERSDAFRELEEAAKKATAEGVYEGLSAELVRFITNPVPGALGPAGDLRLSIFDHYSQLPILALRYGESVQLDFRDAAKQSLTELRIATGVKYLLQGKPKPSSLDAYHGGIVTTESYPRTRTRLGLYVVDYVPHIRLPLTTFVRQHRSTDITNYQCQALDLADSAARWQARVSGIFAPKARTLLEDTRNTVLIEADVQTVNYVVASNLGLTAGRPSPDELIGIYSGKQPKEIIAGLTRDVRGEVGKSITHDLVSTSIIVKVLRATVAECVEPEPIKIEPKQKPPEDGSEQEPPVDEPEPQIFHQLASYPLRDAFRALGIL